MSYYTVCQEGVRTLETEEQGRLGAKGRKIAQEQAASWLKILGPKTGLKDGVTPGKDIDLGPGFEPYLPAAGLGM